MDLPHPMLRQHGFIFTAPPLVEFVREFSRLVHQGELSMVCYGEPRFGKTTARHFIEKGFIENKKMVVVSAIIQRDIKGLDSRNHLWRDFLRSKDMDLSLRTPIPYGTLFNKLLVEADKLGTDKVLVVLDEAQNLSLDKLAALKKLIDELIEHEISPFVLLMSQARIVERPERLKRFHNEDLIDRFFTRMYRFRGLALGEIDEVLAMYDTRVWPEGSGTTYTEHFLPEAWAQGWRLGNHTIVLKTAFANLHKRLNTGSTEVGMKYLTTSVRILLTTLQGRSMPASEDLRSIIQKSVDDCGLTESYRIVGNAEAAASATKRPSRFHEAES